MSVFVAILLGLLQGATVFLPVSYSGHQAIFQNLLKLEVPTQGPFVFLMNLSTLVSILLVYRKDVGLLLHEGTDFLRGRSYEDPMNEGRMSPSIRMLYFIIVGTLPLILTIPINNRIDILLNSAAFIGSAMLAMGALLFVIDRFIKSGKRTEKTMEAKDALFIGLGQALAVIPGLSRIGTAMTIGLVRGMGKEFIIRFSIFLSLPSVALAIIISFFSLFRGGGEWSSFFVYLIAFIVSVLAGYLSIQILRQAARRRKLRNFSYYLWAVGVITIILSFIL
jgi:undecaprenyl-diphosphatase